MPEAFKNVFNPTQIKSLAGCLKRQYPSFKEAAFIKEASKDLEQLELKQRSDQITQSLRHHLPQDFKKACQILTASLHPNRDADAKDEGNTQQGIQGWSITPLANFVAHHGLAHLELSLATLKEMTQRFTAEFAIRPFIIHHPTHTLKTLRSWIDDDNKHVRRLISEGSRPRLPWGLRIQQLVEDPTPILPLLTKLRDDPSEYVRRSVANSLNDIAKDHPDTVAALAKKWLKGASPERKKLIRHACRTLIKQGHTPTLKALGYSEAQVKKVSVQVSTKQVTLGDKLTFELALTSASNAPQDVIIDYQIHHRKANGQTTPKVFKWKVIQLAPQKTVSFARQHSIRPISTRRYYPGEHAVEILINGKAFARESFELIIPQ